MKHLIKVPVCDRDGNGILFFCIGKGFFRNNEAQAKKRYSVQPGSCFCI